MKTTVEQLRDAVDGQQIICIEGIIKSLEKHRSSPPNAAEPYSYQDAVITDNGFDYPACFVSRPPVPNSIVGSRVVIMAYKGKKGYSGVKIREREDYHTKKPKNVLWITASAQCTGKGMQNSETPETSESQTSYHQPPPQTNRPPAQPAQRPPATRQAPPAQQEPYTNCSSEDPTESIDKAMAGVTGHGNLYFLCLKEAATVAQRFREETTIELESDSIQAIAASLFIKMERTGLGFVLPKDDIRRYFPAR